MKWKCSIFWAAPIAAAAVAVALRCPWSVAVPPAPRNSTPAVGPGLPEVAEVPAVALDDESPASLLSEHTGEDRSRAVSELIVLAKTRSPLTAADIQSLLAFISAAKPGDLTDGEWEEWVNEILNLLRRQTQDYKTQDAREEGAGSLAGLGTRVVTNAPTGERQDGKTQDAREDGTGSLAGSGARVVTNAATGDAHSHSSHSSPTSHSTTNAAAEERPNDGIDWAAVDELLGRESGRIIGDAGAAQDVRISAIHACVDRRDAAPLPDLRKIAVDTSLVSTLRKAAIHAIGQLGTVKDLALLDSLPQDDGNLSMAVGPARITLESRMAGTK